MKIFFIGSNLTQINLNELIKANPGKVQCIVLGKKNRLKYSLKIGSIIVKVSVEIQLLGITIDNLKLSKTYQKFIPHCPVKHHA